MARTRRSHLSPSEQAKRGGRSDERLSKTVRKSHKQRRPNERARLRKEWA